MKNKTYLERLVKRWESGDTFSPFLYQSVNGDNTYFPSEILFCDVPEKYFVQKKKGTKTREQKISYIHMLYFFAKRRLLSKTY